ncbi:CBM20 domain-containing protein [Candidatus Finniella inopinata]|uniref:CBM20 domain-containing protein n=1 Tax=Candidatus Finniella inopinata TaxID=1696036 RepID=A0A4Q7DIL2_9PROT|nr:CBM20 domain-containing protein [Candidatus Finniella inopinata]RZI46190.1 hypothetical protein EQU50_04440 [Candidatus Finniella inopinata]
MDAKFLVLRNTAGQAAFDVTFTTSCSATGLGDLIFVVGNHPLLGDWSPRADCLNGLLCTQFGSDPAGLFPKWTSLPLRFPAGTSLEYKYVIAYAGTDKKIKTWESGTDFTVPEKKKKTKSQTDVVHTQAQPQKKLLNRAYTVLSDGTAPVEPASLWPVTESSSDTNNTGTNNNTDK